MSNQKGFSKIALIVGLIVGLGVFFCLFSISKFNKEFNCGTDVKAYVGQGGPRNCQSLIEYMLFGPQLFLD